MANGNRSKRAVSDSCSVAEIVSVGGNALQSSDLAGEPFQQLIS